ncbi:flagellar assembly protein FliW [Desulfovibrio litoralis]|uniref:Flagellar assembly factor FliW n=1 Tax=Desulfovibrio litoralis DSM 11393 TaxID=1121455 RepID=A0A1M7T6D8_9BACT|nr:flagellar assembly protein FliW [Desulfovibrio litoralis]SHN66311.1 flagellar assembly factor FliW [Desulfovibrio litoralis DSM 11393]
MANSNKKEIETRLGKRTITLDKIITFPRGIIGYEEKREFTLLQLKEDAPFLLLQSTEDSQLGFLVCDPFSFFNDYQIKVGDAEQLLLQIERVDQVAVLCTVTIPLGKPEDISINLSGPILINHEAHIGLQVPQVETKYQSRIYLNKLNKLTD